jgi:hypothetical protein
MNVQIMLRKSGVSYVGGVYYIKACNTSRYGTDEHLLQSWRLAQSSCG